MQNEATDKSERLIVIDFFRGAALLVIFWNHLQWVLKTGFPLRYGLSDAAAVFIFLSGYVCGMVYWKTYTRHGFRHTLVKAWRRAGQLYLAHLASLIAVVGITIITPETDLPQPMIALMASLKENLLSATLSILTLRYFPPLFDILPFYIVLMMTVPAILWLIKLDWKILFAISSLLWCVTQITAPLGIEIFPGSWTFNPLSWLMLFSLAMIIGIKNRENTLFIPVRQPYSAIAVCVVLYAFSDLTTINTLLQEVGIVTEAMEWLFPSPFPLIGRPTLEPVYLLHFLSLAYLVFMVSPHLRWLGNDALTKSIALCGQHSLVLFSTGIVLVYLFSTLIIQNDFNLWIFFFFEFLGWTITIAMGALLSRNELR